MRVVEFLASAFSVFPKEMHKAMVENDLYNVILYYFELYPYHNILHQKVYDIFLTALEKNYDDQMSIIEGTNLIKVIIDITSDSPVVNFKNPARHMNKGSIIFIRRISNKIVEIQKKNEDVNICLESIPEWGSFVKGELEKSNIIESRPLA